MFEKVFLVPYEDSANYPALSKYCEENGYSCIFTGDDEAEISGKKYRYTGTMSLAAEITVL